MHGTQTGRSQRDCWPRDGREADATQPSQHLGKKWRLGHRPRVFFFWWTIGIKAWVFKKRDHDCPNGQKKSKKEFNIKDFVVRYHVKMIMSKIDLKEKR